MYRSRYNIEVEGDDGELLLFNSATGAFSVIKGSSRGMYDSYAEGDSGFPEVQKARGRPLLDALASDGFLTLLTPGEELELQRQRFDAARASTDELALCIAPTYRCNQACPYCYVRELRKSTEVMSQETVDAICGFVADAWYEHPFKVLTVQWYGGDPSLCLDVVEDISQRLISFCDSHGADYLSVMTSNCTMLDSDEAVETLIRCRVSSVVVTIDGKEQTHNARRPALDGGNSFERTMGAIRRMREHGILVQTVCNVDKKNWDEFLEMREKLEREGIALVPGKLNDYTGALNGNPLDPGEYDCFDHDEFSQICLDLTLQDGRSLPEMRSMLHPCARFCRGQMDNYLVIDAFGDVYKCDGQMGREDGKLFNILDGVDREALRRITFDATRDPRCSECAFLPICQGSCYWERCCTDMECHPLKITVEGYIRHYRKLFDRMGMAEYMRVSPPLSDREVAGA